MRYHLITETEKTDLDDRITANKLFDAIIDYLKDPDHRLVEVEAFGGSLAMRFTHIDPAYSHLQIIFAPIGKGNNGGGAFGVNHKGDPIIVLYCLLAPCDDRHIDAVVDGSRSTFVHEFIHYLMRERNQNHATTPADAMARSEAAYYNHSEEMNAYYQQGIDDFHRLVKMVNTNGHFGAAQEIWGDLTKTELAQSILDKQFNQQWVKNLSAQNRARVLKRIARFIDETLWSELHQK